MKLATFFLSGNFLKRNELDELYFQIFGCKFVINNSIILDLVEAHKDSTLVMTQTENSKLKSKIKSLEVKIEDIIEEYNEKLEKLKEMKPHV